MQPAASRVASTAWVGEPSSRRNHTGGDADQIGVSQPHRPPRFRLRPYHPRCMGSLSFGEIFTILVIILIIFGPNRLPEFARKVGQLIAWGRKSLQDFTESVQGEAGEGLQPLADLKAEFDGARQDISGAMSTLTGAGTREPLKPQSPGGPGERGPRSPDAATPHDAVDDTEDRKPPRTDPRADEGPGDDATADDPS